MYPSKSLTNLKRPEGAYGQTSLARTFVTTVRLGLARVAPFNLFLERIQALSFQLSALSWCGLTDS